MKRIKRATALALSLCLMVFGAFGVLAEQEDVDVIGDLLNYFLGATQQAQEEEPVQDDAAESYANPEDYVAGEEEYVFDDYEEELQKLTDKKCKELDDLTAKKEAELMAV